MKKSLFLLFFALVTVLSFGQSDYQDVVYLKDGSIVQGLIIEQIPNKSIKIKSADKTVFVFEIDDIEKFTKEYSENESKKPSSGFSLERGYKGIVELGYQAGSSSYSIDRVKLDFTNAYQFDPYLSLGIGFGLRYYILSEDIFIPFFLDFRANFTNNTKYMPYVSLAIGYSYDANGDIDTGGFIFNPSVGVSLKVSEKTAINIGCGYEMQRINDFVIANNYWSYVYQDINVKENYGAISIYVGFLF